jgi:hypothetical protein
MPPDFERYFFDNYKLKSKVTFTKWISDL